MKKIFSVALFIMFSAITVNAQSLQSFFDKYGDDERFQYVSINKGMMNMASVLGGLAKDEQKVMNKMQGLKILTLEEKADSPFLKSITKELYQIIEKGNFESAVEVRDKGERVNIYYRVSGNDNADMVIITKDKGELSCIWIRGKMTKEEMMKAFSDKDAGFINSIG
ncbi:MAG: DUF4252 domain-containing protein [Paludibacter sp.]|nr:DUF4252 domain-containing protein [Paludibacter sp.]